MTLATLGGAGRTGLVPARKPVRLTVDLDATASVSLLRVRRGLQSLSRWSTRQLDLLIPDAAGELLRLTVDGEASGVAMLVEA